ncbi:MAG: MFS transporter, partial [Solirubrobacteraceae bacterium]
MSTTSQPRARPMPGVRLRGMGFWLMACVLGLLVFASSAPSPLYGVYQQKWRFSATALTAIFGVYALALIVTLLMVGALSDYVGRRPVIVAALVVEIGAVSLFLAATGAGWLYGARVLQGCAVGAATSALSAALIDLQPEGSTRAPVVNSFVPGFGLAVGALVTSAPPRSTDCRGGAQRRAHPGARRSHRGLRRQEGSHPANPPDRFCR